MEYKFNRRDELMKDVINEIIFQMALLESLGEKNFDTVIYRDFSLFLNEEDLIEIGNHFKNSFSFKYIIIPLVYAKTNKKSITIKFYKRG